MSIKLFDSQDQASKAVPIGTIRKLIIKGKTYLIVHANNGLLVSDYLCPHQREPLEKGKLNNFDEIICPLHEYRFNLKTGIESSGRCGNLTLYQIAVKSDGLYLEI